ncbi:MAG: glycine zipper family protein [Planctomycetota bacterium]|jgi:uncharacterized membrane protein
MNKAASDNRPDVSNLTMFGMLVGAGLGAVAGLLLDELALGVALGAGIGILVGMLRAKRGSS